jgi:hypothetical protein
VIEYEVANADIAAAPMKPTAATAAINAQSVLGGRELLSGFMNRLGLG